MYGRTATAEAKSLRYLLMYCLGLYIVQNSHSCWPRIAMFRGSDTACHLATRAKDLRNELSEARGRHKAFVNCPLKKHRYVSMEIIPQVHGYLAEVCPLLDLRGQRWALACNPDFSPMRMYAHIQFHGGVVETPLAQSGKIGYIWTS